MTPLSEDQAIASARLREQVARAIWVRLDPLSQAPDGGVQTPGLTFVGLIVFLQENFLNDVAPRAYLIGVFVQIAQ